MRKFALMLLLVFACQQAVSQEFEMIRHQVKMGETVRMLSKKYKVEPSEIYRLNKFAIDGISQGMVLQILVPRKEEPIAETEVLQEEPENTGPSENETVVSQTEIPAAKKKKPEKKPETVAQQTEPQPEATTGQELTHTVAKGETLYSLSKKYNVTVDDIKAQNEQLLKKGLQTGQVLMIRANN